MTQSVDADLSWDKVLETYAEFFLPEFETPSLYRMELYAIDRYGSDI